ncbi:MAG: hypothetical protein J7K83_02045 [Candidatus Aenigmarchaeota archaeon]|nr:hypothetical protein [Candidatus Aenigmarchaeota archaeon]
MDKNFIFGLFILLGTVIGAGILSVPYVFYHLGLLYSLLIMAIVVLFTLYVSFILAEVDVFRKGIKEIPGIFGMYFGEKAKNITFFLQLFSIYGAILAYLIGISTTISSLTGINQTIIGIVTFAIVGLIVYKGKDEVKISQIFLTSIKISVIIVISLFLIARYGINVETGNEISKSMLFSGYGVFMFSFMFYSIIPNLRRFVPEPAKLKKLIIIGVLITLSVYLMFAISTVSAYEENTKEIITVSPESKDEKIMFSILIIFLLITPYITLSWTLKDTFIFDYSMHYKKAWLLSVSVPFLLFLVLPRSFIGVIETVGSVFGTLLYLMILSLRKRKIG